MDKVPDWLDVAEQAGFIYRSPHIRGGTILSPQGTRLSKTLNQIMEEEFSKVGFSLWSFSCRVARMDLDPLSRFEVDECSAGRFDKHLHWLLQGTDELSQNDADKPTEALRPSGESQVYPFWSETLRSYKQLDSLGKVMLQQRFFRVPPTGHKISTKYEAEVNEGHAMFATAKEADHAMMEYLGICQSIADRMGISYVAVESPIWDNNPFNKRASYLCAIQEGGTRLFASAYNQGTALAEAFKIAFTDRDNMKKVPHIATWGSGMMYPLLWNCMDEQGFILPPEVSPIDVVVIPVTNDPDITRYVESIMEVLGKEVSMEVLVNSSLSTRRRLASLRGYPLRLEVGKKEKGEGTVTAYVRWSPNDPESVSLQRLPAYVKKASDSYGGYAHQRAQQVRNTHLDYCRKPSDVQDVMQKGLVGFFDWCGDRSCIESLYSTGKTTESASPGSGKFLGWNPYEHAVGKCIVCNKEAEKIAYWSRRVSI